MLTLRPPRCYIAGRRLHHGLVGAVLTLAGVLLTYHDRRDWPLAVHRPGMRRAHLLWHLADRIRRAGDRRARTAERRWQRNWGHH